MYVSCFYMFVYSLYTYVLADGLVRLYTQLRIPRPQQSKNKEGKTKSTVYDGESLYSTRRKKGLNATSPLCSLRLSTADVQQQRDTTLRVLPFFPPMIYFRLNLYMYILLRGQSFHIMSQAKSSFSLSAACPAISHKRHQASGQGRQIDRWMISSSFGISFCKH